MATRMVEAEIDLQEQMQRIRQLIAESEARVAEGRKADREREQMGFRLVLTAMAAGAGLVTALAAVMTAGTAIALRYLP